MSATIEVPVGEKVLLTIPEASAMFSIGEKKMRELLNKEAHGSVVKIGSKTLVNKELLSEFFKKCRFFD